MTLTLSAAQGELLFSPVIHQMSHTRDNPITEAFTNINSSGFGINAPYYTSNSDRPFSGAACTSNLGPGQLYDITSYDSTAYLTVVPTSAPTDGTVIRVNAFDGIAANVPTQTSISSSTTLVITTSASSMSTPCPTDVAVTFEIPYCVGDDYLTTGEDINLIGSVDALGDWVIADSIRMSDDVNNATNCLWETTISLPAGTYLEYKYLHIGSDGSVTWSTDPNYSVTIVDDCAATEVLGDWWR
jgi:hypothetical protein